MTIDERLDRLTASAESHDAQIGALVGAAGSLIKVAEIQSAEIDKLQKAVAATERQWQAYINTLPRQ